MISGKIGADISQSPPLATAHGFAAVGIAILNSRILSRARRVPWRSPWRTIAATLARLEPYSRVTSEQFLRRAAPIVDPHPGFPCRTIGTPPLWGGATEGLVT
jgi:hypothetical protein